MANHGTGEVKKTIMKESMRLFLANGFQGTSVKEITEAARIGRGTLYWYFKSKNEIVESIIGATTAELKEFKERDLSEISAFAFFIDTVHRGKDAFMVALRIHAQRNKHALGFWHGATENHEICEETLAA